MNLPNLVGRALFLISLRNQWPDFWRALKEESSRTGGVPVDWLKSCGLVDSWIIEEVARPTVEDWMATPNSPNAELAFGYPWFTYRPKTTFPNFAPVFSDPRPIVRQLADDLITKQTPGAHYSELKEIAAATKVETVDEFASRMKKQFSQQLKDYKQLLRRAFPSVSSRTEMAKHADWTALVMSGKTLAHIAEPLFGMQQGYEDPEKAVYRAVTRFAADIGLTLIFKAIA